MGSECESTRRAALRKSQGRDIRSATYPAGEVHLRGGKEANSIQVSVVSFRVGKAGLAAAICDRRWTRTEGKRALGRKHAPPPPGLSGDVPRYRGCRHWKDAQTCLEIRNKGKRGRRSSRGSYRRECRVRLKRQAVEFKRSRRAGGPGARPARAENGLKWVEQQPAEQTILVDQSKGRALDHRQLTRVVPCRGAKSCISLAEPSESVLPFPPLPLRTLLAVR